MFAFILGAIVGIASGTYSHVFYKNLWEKIMTNFKRG